jgi:hypothetical protein
MKPRIFIGSSTEGLATAEFVKKSLEPEFDCVIWNDGSVFGLNVSYLDSLLRAGSMFDFGILVATKDDKTRSRDKGFDTPRDNVIFEFGLFMGALGKFRTLILLESGAKLPSDMSGIHISQYTGGKAPAGQASLKKQLAQLRAHIQERCELLELGLLPSAAAAMGYYSNFVERTCKYLRETGRVEINGKRYDSFEIRVIIPKQLERDMLQRAGEYCHRHGFKSHGFSPKVGRPISLAVKPDPKQRGKLLICDMPTTLTPLYDAIEMYLQKGHIGKSKAQELIEARELNNFMAVLRAKVDQDSFCQKVVRYVEE